MPPSSLILAALLWTALAVVAYAYVGYPVVVFIASRLFGRYRPGPDPRDSDLPRLSLLIAAYNEESVIEGRIENALAMDYPSARLEIVVATDGCADRTAAIARRYTDRGVRVFEYPERRGKATVLNEAVGELTGSIVMFSDANTHTDADAARRLVRWFSDNRIGAVCGRLVLTDPKTGRNVDGLYWKYETFLKRQEGRLGALLGANGGIYAIRRELIDPLPPDAILDDMLIPLRARLKSGKAIVFDPAAVAHEETAASVRAEFQRRSRIGAGGFGSLGLLAGLLNPARGWVSFAFWSHKVLRWCGPFALLGAFAANVALADSLFYAGVLLAQLAFYTTALVAAFLPSQQTGVRVLRLTTMFTSMNWALLVGFGRWARGTQAVTWKRTSRLAETRS